MFEHLMPFVAGWIYSVDSPYGSSQGCDPMVEPTAQLGHWWVSAASLVCKRVWWPHGVLNGNTQLPSATSLGVFSLLRSSWNVCHQHNRQILITSEIIYYLDSGIISTEPYLSFAQTFALYDITHPVVLLFHELTSELSQSQSERSAMAPNFLAWYWMQLASVCCCMGKSSVKVLVQPTNLWYWHFQSKRRVPEIRCRR